MKLGLEGRTCLVTGASAGIGRACAVELATEGAKVVMCARNAASLAPVEAEIAALGAAPPVCLAHDLATAEGPVALAQAALAAAGRIDVLVNNAGGSRPLSPDAGEDDWAESMALNFHAARLLSERLLPGMRAAGWGRVINVTGAIVAKAMNAASPAKAALESWSKATAATVAPDGVTVNSVAPGRINSVQILNRRHPTKESRQLFIERNIPMGRFGEPAELAALVAFLASARASYITGVTIPVDGGALRFAF